MMKPIRFPRQSEDARRYIDTQEGERRWEGINERSLRFQVATRDQFGDLTTNITSVQRDVGSVQGSVDSLATTVGSIASDVTNLNNLKAVVADLQERMISAEGQISSGNSRMNGFASNITSLLNRMATAEEALNNHESRIHALEVAP